MIDRIETRIGPKGIDKVEYQKLLKELNISGSFEVRHLKPRADSFMGGEVTLDIFPTYIDIAFCPMKVQGSGNCYGGNDLQLLFCECAPLIFDALGVSVPPSVRKLIKRGEYRLKEVHVTEHFYLGGYSISECIRELERALQGTYPIQRSIRGVGFEINPRSRRLVVLIYNKLWEFQKKGQKLYVERMAKANDWVRPLLGLELSIQQFSAAAGPRMEFRFKDHFFHKGQPLRIAKNWMPGTAEALYRQELADLTFPSRVDAVWARRKAEVDLTPQAMRTYLLWARGEPKQVVTGTPDTWRVHQREIADVMGVDINSHPSAVLGQHSVDIAKLFAWENRVVLTDWVLDHRLGSLNEHMPLLA